MLEKIVLRLSDVTIICDEERKEQLNCTPKELWVLPNIPDFNFKKSSPKNESEVNKTIRLSYVGAMPADRGIEKMLECVRRNPALQLDIAGFGIMDKMVKNYSDECPNISFYGTVPYEKGIQIMENSDIIMAIYEKVVLNNVYAAPNKYYEGLYLGKPILTTLGTLVGNHTEKYKTGFVIGESLADLESFWGQEHLQQLISEYGKNAKNLWEEKFKSYVQQFMIQKYLPFIKSKK